MHCHNIFLVYILIFNYYLGTGHKVEKGGGGGGGPEEMKTRFLKKINDPPPRNGTKFW